MGFETKFKQMTRRESGQTLIETIMALFVLTTGLSSGLALAVFAFGASTEITEKIAATGLAREGIEVVRRMRDSNWLAEKEDGNLENCNDLGTGQVCYEDWLNSTYDIRGTSGGRRYRLVFDPTATGNKWSLPQSDNDSVYRLYQQSGGGLSHNSGTPTNFFRKFYIFDQQTSSPYSDQSPLTLVRVIVWWHGKRCNNNLTNYTDPSDTTCKIISEEYLTNWRNY